MANVTVKHILDNKLSEMHFIFDDNKRLEKVRELFNDDSYEVVADLVLGGSLSNVLEEAHRLTNNIDEPWFENPEILVCDRARLEGCRSTCVGDIIIVAGEAYAVMGFGFKHLCSLNEVA